MPPREPKFNIKRNRWVLHVNPFLIDYEDEDTWKDAVHSPMPTVLLVAGTSVFQRRLQRFLKRQLSESYTDVIFLVTNRDMLASATQDDIFASS